MSTEIKNGENHEEINLEEDFTPEVLQEIADAEAEIEALKDKEFDDLSDEERIKFKEATEVLTKNLKTTIAQKNHWKQKATKANEKPEDKKPAESKKQEDEKITKTDILEFRQDTGYSKDIVQEIADYAKAHGLTLEEAEKKPIIQTYIKNVEKEREVDGASVAPSRRGNSAPVTKERDWSTVSKAEFLKKRNEVANG